MLSYTIVPKSFKINVLPINDIEPQNIQIYVAQCTIYNINIFKTHIGQIKDHKLI
jgi:hypothetical protein